ncbi:MAG: RNase adapter RapZ [Acidimicrobiia bacterium]
MDPVSNDTPNVLIVTGMSGAGRSSAAKILEDLGYVVIDNLPPSLLDQVVQAHDIPEANKRLVVVIDSRGGLPIEELEAAITEMAREGVITRIVFLDADDEVILRRYEENRRPHPLGGDIIADAIAAERKLLVRLREMADVIVDTSDLNIHQLRDRLTEQFSAAQAPRPMNVAIRSFGFKHGTPRDVDLLFDVRFLPNPHWIPELRPLPGTDKRVADYVLSSEGAREFLDRVDELLAFLIPRYQAEGKSYLSIGVGCTGGHHRSVAIATELQKRVSAHDVGAAVSHRDLEK